MRGKKQMAEGKRVKEVFQDIEARLQPIYKGGKVDYTGNIPFDADNFYEWSLRYSP